MVIITGNRTQQAVRQAFWPLVCICMLGLVIAGYLLAYGQVTGVEFCPERCVHRSYHYYAIDGLRIGPQQTREWQSPLDRYWSEQGWVEVNGTSSSWVIINQKTGRGPVESGPAEALCRELHCLRADNGIWVAWSHRHPGLAEKLWPRIISLIRNRQYDQIQNALLAAKLAENDGNFEQYFREFVTIRLPESLAE